MAGRKRESVDGMQYMLLRQRVSQAMDSTGWSTVLILLDVALSFMSVLLYIIMTYNIQVLLLYDIDFALAIFFSLNWLFWFWLAEDRLRYVFSFFSLVDAVTIIPSFVLYSLEGELATTIPGLNFLRILRILRVLRVFRMKHVMQRHLEGAVFEAAGKLIFSLISILFIAAGLFYELEKAGPSDPNTDSEFKQTLMFHQALYWASVTLSTVGYGDFSPTWWATQMMLMLLLGLTFVVLPWLTGQLMDALGSSTHYQRNRFKSFARRSDVGHVVFMGALDGSTMEGLMNELYHEDKGFNHQHCVFLSPRAPTMDQRHVLQAHHAASKMHYLQGSPFKTQDLNRAACEYASAIFLIAPKHAEEPLLADRHTIMITLSLGQYLQEAHVALRCELQSLPNRVSHWFTHGHIQPPRSLPTIFIQIMLPEGRIRLHQVLRSLQDTNRDSLAAAPSAYSAATAAAEAAAAAANKQLRQQGSSEDVQGPDDTDHYDMHQHFVAAAADTYDVYSQLPQNDGSNMASNSPLLQQQQHQEVALEAGAAAGAAAAVKAASAAAAAGVSTAGTVTTAGIGGRDRSKMSGLGLTESEVATGAAYWQKFGHAMRVMCLSDLKHAMMAHSMLGVPGVMTLLSNLSTTADFGADSLSQSSGVPVWLKDYMMGASQELYELVAFPTALQGQSFKTAASFIYHHCRAVLLAVEGTQGSKKHHLSVADLNQVIDADMRGFIIAEDIGAVVSIMATEDEDFQEWEQEKQKRLTQLKQHSLNKSPRQVGQQQQQQRQWLPQWMQMSEQQRKQQGISDGSTPSKKAFKVVRPLPTKQSLTLNHSITDDDRDRWLSDGHSPQHSPRHTSRDIAHRMQSHTASPGPSIADAAAASAAVAAISRVGAVGHSSKDSTAALAAVIHLLRSPSRQLQQYGEGYMREHYHLRRKGAVQSSGQMVVQAVPKALSGHVLVLGVPRSQESLLALLAPLRSRRLSNLRPIVVIDAQLPGRGGCWDTLAKFKQTYFIQMREGLNEALLNANAESASHAVLLSPLSAHEEESEENRLASKVLTDAMVIHMYQLLRSLNPHMQLVAELMLPQNMAYLAPMVPLKGVPTHQQTLLSPAFISGSVFMSRTLDDLMIASYCNNTGDRIILKLLHRWHLAGRSAVHMRQAFDACADCNVKQNVAPNTQPQQKGQQQQQQQQEGCVLPKQQRGNPPPPQQQQQQQHRVTQDIEAGMDSEDQWGYECYDGAAAAAAASSPRQQQQQHREQQRVDLIGAEDSDADGGCGEDDCAAVDAAATDAESSGVHAPTIMLVPVDDCHTGTPYHSYFHHLLWGRGLLLLGVYRVVNHGGLQYRATITNPHRTDMQRGDLAYVVKTLTFPEGFSNKAAAAAAWPPDAWGFNNLVPQPAPVIDPLDQLMEPAAAAAAAGQQQQQGDEQLDPISSDGERPSGSPAGCNEAAAAAAAAAAPADQAVQTTEDSAYFSHRSNSPLPAAAAAEHPPGKDRPMIHSSSAPDAAQQSNVPRSDSSLPFSTKPRMHSQSTLLNPSDRSAEFYTPAATASSGSMGPGVSADVPRSSSTGDLSSHRTVIVTPGLTTTAARAVPVGSGFSRIWGQRLSKDGGEGSRALHSKSEQDMTLSE